MLIVDALIAIAQSDVPDQLARYREIAPHVIGNVPDAVRELLRARLSSFDSTLGQVSGGPEVYETGALEQAFAECFVAAVRAGHYTVRGFRPSDLDLIDIPRVLITVEALRHIKGDEWRLAGTIWYGVHVLAGASPAGNQSELPPASTKQIHDAIDAEYTDCEATGRPPPNVKKIGAPVLERLRKKRTLRDRVSCSGACWPIRRPTPQARPDARFRTAKG